MHLSTAFLSILSVVSAIASPIPEGNAIVLDKRTVPSDVYHDLVFYFKYASSAYASSCARPNGNTHISTFRDTITDTQGFVARDDTKKEIVVSLRGSTSPTDFIVTAKFFLTPFESPGVSAPDGTRVHSGFLAAWNAVAPSVIATVRSQLADHPGYSIATTGHSLGGALSSIAGISLKQNFPKTKLRLFSYGQPRTGNTAYASFVNKVVGVSNSFRSVHTLDPGPNSIPRSLGYRHHATEFWQTPDPASPHTTEKCNASGEDPKCSDSVTSSPLNVLARMTYYNILASRTFCT